MRALTGSDVLVENKLFATLGTTVRALQPETTPRILVSDTVGFIRNLPHALIASFRATLAEAHEADLLLNVADASDAELEAQLQVTFEVLGELGASDVPRLLVLNKVDRLTAPLRAELERRFPDALFVSAHDPSLVALVRERVQAFFDARLVDSQLRLTYGELPWLARIREHARVVSENYTDDGVELLVRGTESGIGRIERFLATNRAESAVSRSG
jgi:GTP-binding protein HflX